MRGRCAEDERVAVRRRFRYHLGTDATADAGPVVDDHLLAPFLRELRAENATGDVSRAACGERYDQPHLLCRPRLGETG
jgi:hypothetical protein